MSHDTIETPASTADPRTELVRGLRALADLFELHSELPLPRLTQEFSWITTGGRAPHEQSEAAEVAAILAAWPVEPTIHVPTTPARVGVFDMEARLHGLRLRVLASRSLLLPVAGGGGRHRRPDPADELAGHELELQDAGAR